MSCEFDVCSRWEDFSKRFYNVLYSELGFHISSENDNQNIESDLGADSLDKVELILELENEFGITLPQEAELKDTVGELKHLVWVRYLADGEC